MKTRYITLKVTLVSIVAAMVALWAIGQVQASTGLLDGKTFFGPTGEKGKEAKGEDELRFYNGMLFSVGCADWGFAESDYTARVEGNGIHFESVTLSPKHGKIVWKGTVQGDKIDATYVWTKERWYWKDAHQEKWFKGTVKK